MSPSRSMIAHLACMALLFAPLAACDESSASGPTADVRHEIRADVGHVDVDVADVGSAETAQGDDASDVLEVRDQPPLRQIPPGPWSVHEPGPYGVGFRESSVSYQPVGVGGVRTLRLLICYPTLVERWYEAAYFGLLPRPNVFDEPATAPGAFPLMVFSHGSNSFAEQSYYLTEFFASHGFVVAAPDHTGNTAAELDQPMDPAIFFLRLQDISAVIDAMQSMPAGDPLTVGINDTIVVGRTAHRRPIQVRVGGQSTGSRDPSQRVD